VTATDAATDSSFWPLSSGGPGIRILWQRQQEANKQRSNANTRQMGSRHPGIQGAFGGIPGQCVCLFCR